MYIPTAPTSASRPQRPCSRHSLKTWVVVGVLPLRVGTCGQSECEPAVTPAVTPAETWPVGGSDCNGRRRVLPGVPCVCVASLFRLYTHSLKNYPCGDGAGIGAGIGAGGGVSGLSGRRGWFSDFFRKLEI